VSTEADHCNEILVVFDIDCSAAEAQTLFAQTIDPEHQAAMKEGGVKRPAQELDRRLAVSSRQKAARVLLRLTAWCFIPVAGALIALPAASSPQAP
jgi:hypothetical protein